MGILPLCLSLPHAKRNSSSHGAFPPRKELFFYQMTTVVFRGIL